ncbi:MAG: hypothetical protein AAGF51_05205 [Pseudomonadota bacterium]
MTDMSVSDAAVQDMDGDFSVAKAKGRYRRFKVDLWATSVNDVEIGIMRQTQHRAKTSQFTKDMDVIGQIRDADNNRTGILAYRYGLWRKEGAKKRLVIKLFTDKMYWRATMDMMVGRSLQLTHGADGVPVTAYSMNIARTEQVIQIERSADKWWFWPEKFSFFILDDKGPRYYKLKQNLFSIGRDYILYDQRDRRIGYLDGKLVSFGGLWKVKVLATEDDPKLDAAIQLFCGHLRFNKAARRHVKSMADDIRAGKIEPSLDHYEKDLYMNPRRTR